MTNLGILSGTISDNKAIILYEDAKGSNAPYLFGSVYNAGTSAVTLKVNLNTKGGVVVVVVVVVVELSGIVLTIENCPLGQTHR